MPSAGGGYQHGTRLDLSLLVRGILLNTWTLPRLLTYLIGLPFILKLGVSAIVLGPLGLAMGMPFPTGLRAISKSNNVELSASEFGEPAHPEDPAVEWAWAMNAASSVLGSVLAMVIAIRFGLNVTLASGAAAYGLAWALFPALAPRSRAA